MSENEIENEATTSVPEFDYELVHIDGYERLAFKLGRGNRNTYTTQVVWNGEYIVPIISVIDESLVPKF